MHTRRTPMRVLSANAKGVFENAIFTLTFAYEWCTGKWIREGLQTGGLCIVATPPLLDDFLEAIENAAWDESLCSGRANFWGDAYTVRKWTRNLRTKNRKCVPTKRNETNDAFQKDLYYRVHQTIQRKKCSQTMRAFLYNTRVPSVIVCIACSLRLLSPDFCESGTHRFHDFAYS